MPKVLYSSRAEQELSEIIGYTRQTWGESQAQAYLDGLMRTFSLLTQYNSLGRPFSKKNPAWRRFEHANHIILYQPLKDGIRIQRLLHERQIVER